MIHPGAVQALVEVDVVKNTLCRYLSVPANRVFTAIEELLTPYLEKMHDGILQCHIEK